MALAVFAIFAISLHFTSRAAAQSAERLSLDPVPRDATFVFSVRPAELATRDELRELAQLIDREAIPLKEAGTSLRDIRELMIITYSMPPAPPMIRTVVRFVDAAHAKQFVDVLEKKYNMKKAADTGIWKDDGEQIMELDPATLLIEKYMTLGPSARPTASNPRPRWAAAWEERKAEPAVAVIDADRLRPVAQQLMQMRAMQAMSMQVVAPVIDNTDWAVLALDLRDKLRLTGTVKCDSAESTKSVAETLQAVAVLMKNFTNQQASRPLNLGPADARATQFALMARISREVAKLLDQAEFKAEGERVQIALESPLTASDVTALAKSLVPAVHEARQAAQRTVDMNNVKQLALAMLNYEATTRQYPAAASQKYRAGGSMQQSKYPHSWRIDILPFLEEQSLYTQYRFDEPWDSEANKKFLEKMPSVFRSTKDPDPKSTNTSYFVFTGPGTLFEGEQGTSMRQITDGTSRTILLVEARRSVPWTKPEDIAYVPDKPLPKLGGWWPDEFLVSLCDGSVFRIASGADEAALRLWITKADGQIAPDLPNVR
jgi:hypothetical protein